jgi:methyl-accepting chemotaxis protein
MYYTEKIEKLPKIPSLAPRRVGGEQAARAADCRNRRKFDDPVGLKAARNRDPFIVQSYRREMGGGKAALILDVAAPIIVKGRHWGGLRLGYT